MLGKILTSVCFSTQLQAGIEVPVGVAQVDKCLEDLVEAIQRVGSRTITSDDPPPSANHSFQTSGTPCLRRPRWEPVVSAPLESEGMGET
jgi:hypothetical protein